MGTMANGMAEVITSLRDATRRVQIDPKEWWDITGLRITCEARDLPGSSELCCVNDPVLMPRSSREIEDTAKDTLDSF